MTEQKICPLNFDLVNDARNGGDYYIQNYECIKEKCIWWIEQYKQILDTDGSLIKIKIDNECAIIAIAQKAN